MNNLFFFCVDYFNKLHLKNIFLQKFVNLPYKMLSHLFSTVNFVYLYT